MTDIDKIAIKIINLAHRKDRRDQATSELESAGVKDYKFVEAKHVPELGARGCSMSHAKALSDFMFYDDKEFVLVLEDDFKIEKDVNLIKVIGTALEHSGSWDVFLLAHFRSIPIQGLAVRVDNQIVNRVINSYTMSAYLVKRSFVPALIKCYYDSSELLKRYADLPTHNASQYKHFVCCDILWHPLQINHVFWAIFPASIKQRPSFSDIEKKKVNYKY